MMLCPQNDRIRDGIFRNVRQAISVVCQEFRPFESVREPLGVPCACAHLRNADFGRSAVSGK